MIRSTSLAVLFAISASVATSETVTDSETFEDRSGYPCFVQLNTDADKKITLQLSDYKDVWSLHFLISDRANIYRKFFDKRGLRDEAAFTGAFGEVRIGKRTIDFNDISFLEVQRQNVNEKTFGIFSIEEQHNVARALGAMADDEVEIQELISLDGTAEALKEFRSCSYAAMGLREGQRVETDFRAEYRMIFEGAFENWVASMARAEHCLAGRFDDDAVAKVVAAAGSAFYPGALKFRKRNEYRDDLEGRLPIAKLSGMANAKTEGCFMASMLADAARIPVDRAIEEAAKLD